MSSVTVEDPRGDRRTIRQGIEAADAARFVGRDHELSVARDLLDPATSSRVLYVHGPGGIGKSALLRAIGRLGVAAGYEVVSFGDAGTRSGAGRFDEWIRGGAGLTVQLVDEADELGSELASVRDRLLDTLPDTHRIVFAGRKAPDPTWRAGGLDAVLIDLPLAPLPDEAAAELLSAHGIDPAEIGGIVDWAQGSPLALTVAALAPGGPTVLPRTQALESRLTTWLTGHPMLEVEPDILEVAALTPVVDARLLAAALPSRRTRGSMARLVGLPVFERVGDRAVLHRVLAAATRARFAESEPERFREVMRRIVVHLGSRARLGDIGALVELSQFVTEPKMRQAISNRPSPSLFTERAGEDELETFGRFQGLVDNPDWEELLRFSRSSAPHRLVVRRVDRSVVLYGAFGRADQIDDLGLVTASLRQAVTESAVDPEKSFVGIVSFADAPVDLLADAARLGTGALMHLHGVADMQAVLIHYPAPDRRPYEALAAIAAPLPGARDRQVALSDFRPFGAAGFVESIVLAELGVSTRRVDHTALLADDGDAARSEALRVRLAEVFDDSPKDRRLCQVIELAHLGPRPSEQECLDQLHVSRRTWFRLLREARERVIDPSR